MTAPVLQTERLRLRPHVLQDWDAIAAFYESGDSRFVGGPLDRRRTWYGFGADVGSWDLLGFGCWAMEERASGALAGQVGLNRPPHFPEAEIGWLTFPAFQRRGYAREAATAARAFAYGALGWATAVSYVDPANAASIAVARALGCVEDAGAVGFDAKDIVFRHPSPASPGVAA